MPESVTVSDWGEITVAEKPDDLEWDGHVFTFWNTQPDGSGKTYSPGDTERLTGDLELYAMWTELITVNYDLNGGEGCMQVDVSSLPAGVYMYGIKSRANVYGIKKLVVK